MFKLVQINPLSDDEQVREVVFRGEGLLNTTRVDELQAAVDQEGRGYLIDDADKPRSVQGSAYLSGSEIPHGSRPAEPLGELRVKLTFNQPVAIRVAQSLADNAARVVNEKHEAAKQNPR